MHAHATEVSKRVKGLLEKLIPPDMVDQIEAENGSNQWGSPIHIYQVRAERAQSMFIIKKLAKMPAEHKQTIFDNFEAWLNKKNVLTFRVDKQFLCEKGAIMVSSGSDVISIKIAFGSDWGPNTSVESIKQYAQEVGLMTNSGGSVGVAI